MLTDQANYTIAFAGLRQLAQCGSPFVVVVEDLGTERLLLGTAGLTQSAFVCNLRQLGCTHLTKKEGRHNSGIVIDLVQYAEREIAKCLSESLRLSLATRLRGLVDRDICPTYSPMSAMAGALPPCKHAIKLSQCSSLRTTPLNDVEVTFFIRHLALLLERLNMLDCARAELGLSQDEPSARVARRMVLDWLLPLYCVRSFFSRQTPSITGKGIAVLIGCWALPKIVACSAADRGVQIAQSAPGVSGALLPEMEMRLHSEIAAAESAECHWPHLVHGHDLMQILGMLYTLTQGGGPILAAHFNPRSPGAWADSEGAEKLREREHVAFSKAQQALRGERSPYVDTLVTSLFSP